MTTHENFSVVLIQSTLVVANSRHVFDDYGVIRVLALLVEDSVGRNHVINNVGLRNLLRAELLLRAEVLSVVVAKVVVASNGGELDTSANQEVYKSRLHLSLARLEVITANESVVLLGELDGTWYKCVLRRSIDEWDAFENTGDSKDSGWCDFLVAILDSFQEVVSSVIDTLDELGETLRIGGPLNDDFVQPILGLEVPRCM